MFKKAAARKMKYKQHMKKIMALQEDDDGSISSDNIDELEMNILGSILNDEYIIIKYIGRGTFSRVWLAYHIPTQDYLVLKIYFTDDKSEFEKEKQILSRITRNQMKYNIGYINTFSHSFDKESTSYILVLPYLGITLSDIRDELDRPLDLKEIKSIIRALLNSINELHSHSILHTDMKMDNFLSDHYLNNNLEFVEWFNTINIDVIYKQILESNTPSNLSELNKHKRKQVKRKIKLRSIKSLSNKVRELLKDYQANSIGLSGIDLENHDLNMGKLKDETTEETKEDSKEDSKEAIKGGTNEDINENNIEDILDSNLNEIDLNNVDLNNVDGCNTNNNTESQLINGNIDIYTLNWTLTDFSNSILESEIDIDDEYQIRAYRAPENIIGNGYCYKSEVWAIGCIIWKLLTNEYIFEPALLGSSENRDREQLSLMQTHLGKMNTNISLECPRTYELFEETGKVKGFKKIKRQYLEDILREKREDLTGMEINITCNYLQNLWNYDIKQRFTVHQCLNNEFLVESNLSRIN